MLFDCPKCTTRYDESEETLRLHRFRVKCARCQAVFVADDVETAEMEDTAPEITFDDSTKADTGEVDFDDHTTVDEPAEFNDSTVTIESRPPVKFDDATQMDPLVNAPTTKDELPSSPVDDFSDLPDLSTGMGIFDDRTNPRAVSIKAVPKKPPASVIPEMDPDLFSDKTRQVTPTRKLLEETLPDLIDVDKDESD